MTTDFQDIFYSELIKKVRKVRLDLNMTQSDFAENLGLSRASIVNIEKGRQKPSIHLLYEISLLAKLDMNFFFNTMPDKNNFSATLPKLIKQKLDKELDENAKNTILRFFSTINDDKK